MIWRLAWRSVWHGLARSLAIIIGVGAACMAFILISSFEHSWSQSGRAATTTRLVVRSRESLLATVPVRAAHTLRSDPAIGPKLSHVSYGQWFGARVAGREQEFFASYAVDGAAYFQSLGSLKIEPNALGAFSREPDAAIVGDLLAQRFGWKVGDKISVVSGLYPERDVWEFHVVGI